MPLVINTLEADTYTYQRLVVNKRNFKKPGAHHTWFKLYIPY